MDMQIAFYKISRSLFILIYISDMSFGFNKERTLFKDVDFGIDMNSRSKFSFWILCIFFLRRKLKYNSTDLYSYLSPRSAFDCIVCSMAKNF